MQCASYSLIFALKPYSTSSPTLLHSPRDLLLGRPNHFPCCRGNSSLLAQEPTAKEEGALTVCFGEPVFTCTVTTNYHFLGMCSFACCMWPYRKYFSFFGISSGWGLIWEKQVNYASFNVKCICFFNEADGRAESLRQRPSELCLPCGRSNCSVCLFLEMLRQRRETGRKCVKCWE